MRIIRQQREALNGHKGGVIYLTGLSGAGKSTIAVLLEQRLHDKGLRTFVLDGDELRQGINRGLGFTDADRIENVRRVTEIARLMTDAGLIVIVALISPFASERDAAKARFAPDDFMEVFVDAPLTVCEQRDPKGLYQRARRKEIVGFTGIDSRYEPPQQPALRLDTTRLTPLQAVDTVIAQMAESGYALQTTLPAAARWG